MAKKKLFIQIPCFNEEKTLPSVIADLPDSIEGIDEIYTLVIDDGSTDKTVAVAKEIGVDFIVQNHRNLGLAKSFSKGIEACLYLGADIIVNTDGDNQYCGADIPELVKPLLMNRTDIVVGCRNITSHKEFSWLKKSLQLLGSKVVRLLSKTDVPDVTSGFRAISKEAGIRCYYMNGFSYTVEMLIQAGRTNLTIDSVPIRTNPKTRESRLFKSMPDFILKQLQIMITLYIFYRPFKLFGILSAISMGVSILLSSRIFYHLWFLNSELAKFKTGTGILLMVTAVVTILFLIAGVLASVLSGLRFLAIDIRSRIREIEINLNHKPLNCKIITAKKMFQWQKTRLKT